MASAPDPLPFLQFWILPGTPSLTPSVEQRQFTLEDRRDRWLPVLGPKGDDIVTVHQDATAAVASLGPGVSIEHDVDAGRGAYLYVMEGSPTLGDDERLDRGDAVKIFGPEGVRTEALEPAELIVVDVPAAQERVGVWAR